MNAAVMLNRALPFAAAAGLLVLLRTTGLGVAGSGPQSVTVAIGFLLIAAFIGGKVAARIGLPRITGYLAVGVAVGPHGSALLTHDMLAASKTIEGVAVALIALTAGGEIKLEWLRREARRLLTITLCELLVVGTLVFLLLWLARDIFPFVPSNDTARAVVVAMVFGAIAVANSPTVTIAVIAETASEGPLSRTVLGVTIVKDVFVIVLFATALAVAKNALGEGGESSLGLTLLRELGGSALVGLAIGAGIALFLRYVDRDTPVFILAVCFGISVLSEALHIEALLVALTAGFWVENVSQARGERLIHGIERLSLPIYALFFAVAGAKVNLGALADLWYLALLIAAVRMAGVWGGTRLGATLSKSDPVIRQYAWLGFISQAGVTLALSSIVARAFPDWGPGVQVVIVAMIAIHEFVGPIGLQFALRRAGEIGAATRLKPTPAGKPPAGEAL